MRSTAQRTFTASILDVEVAEEAQIEAEGIFEAPAAYVQKLVATSDKSPATILNNLRHGELSIPGDRRRWFLHQVRFLRYHLQDEADVEDLFLIVTADER